MTSCVWESKEGWMALLTSSQGTLESFPSLTLTWYDGDLMPPRSEEVPEDIKMGDTYGGALFLHIFLNQRFPEDITVSYKMKSVVCIFRIKFVSIICKGGIEIYIYYSIFLSHFF